MKSGGHDWFVPKPACCSLRSNFLNLSRMRLGMTEIRFFEDENRLVIPLQLTMSYNLVGSIFNTSAGLYKVLKPIYPITQNQVFQNGFSLSGNCVWIFICVFYWLHCTTPKIKLKIRVHCMKIITFYYITFGVKDPKMVWNTKNTDGYKKKLR